MKKVDLQKALAKAGAPSASEIPARRRRSGSVARKDEEAARSNASGSSKDSGTSKAPAKQPLLREEKLQSDLKVARQKAHVLEREVQDLKHRLKDQKERADRAKAKAEEADQVVIELRRTLGAGKDAKPASLSPRLNQRIQDLEKSEQIAREEGNSFRDQIDTLKNEILQANEENSRLKRDLETIVINRDQEEGRGVRSSWNGNPPSPVDETATSDERALPVFFGSLIHEEQLPAISKRYIEWVLGEEDSRSRRGRIALGVDPTWRSQDLVNQDSISLEGKKGLRAEIRSVDDYWILQFDHPHPQEEGTIWSNLVRLTKDSSGRTFIEHAITRSTEVHARRPSAPGCPRILKEFFKQSPQETPWYRLDGKPRMLRNPEDVGEFVSQILLNSGRDLPVVFISRAESTGHPVIDPEELSKKLDGIAVVFVEAFEDRFLLTDELKRAGLGRQLSCWDGGIRIYRPGIGPDSDPYSHPLWLGSRIERYPVALKSIVEAVATSTAGSRVPPSFARLIEDHDLRTVKDRAAKLAKLGDTEARISALETQINGLEDALVASRADNEIIPELRRRLSDAESMSMQLLEERDQQRQEIGSLKLTIEAANQRPQEPTQSIDHGSLLKDLLKERWSPIGSIVRQVQAAFPGRIEILDSGLDTADGCTFQQPERVRKLLLKLAEDYYESLCEGGGDAQAAGIFGDNYGPKESNNLSKEGRRARTFRRGDEMILMERHLKFTGGHSRASNTVLRIHFEWDSSLKKILIGHIGGHLPL